MIVAIACPGPSLKRTFPLPKSNHYSAVLAVNNAVNHVDHDWFVAGDGAAYHLFNHAPSAGYCSPRKVLRDKGKDAAGVSWEQLSPPLWATRANPIECHSSTVVAIALALWLGAQEIHIYGADMTCEKDACGLDSPAYNEERWVYERGALRTIADIAMKDYVRIKRILPNREEWLHSQNLSLF